MRFIDNDLGTLEAYDRRYFNYFDDIMENS